MCMHVFSRRVAAVGLTYLCLGGVFAIVALGFLMTRFPAADVANRQGQPFRASAICACLRVRGFACGVLAQVYAAHPYMHSYMGYIYASLYAWYIHAVSSHSSYA